MRPTPHIIEGMRASKKYGYHKECVHNNNFKKHESNAPIDL